MCSLIAERKSLFRKPIVVHGFDSDEGVLIVAYRKTATSDLIRMVIPTEKITDVVRALLAKDTPALVPFVSRGNINKNKWLTTWAKDALCVYLMQALGDHIRQTSESLITLSETIRQANDELSTDNETINIMLQVRSALIDKVDKAAGVEKELRQTVASLTSELELAKAKADKLDSVLHLLTPQVAFFLQNLTTVASECRVMAIQGPNKATFKRPTLHTALDSVRSYVGVEACRRNLPDEPSGVYILRISHLTPAIKELLNRGVITKEGVVPVFLHNKYKES